MGRKSVLRDAGRRADGMYMLAAMEKGMEAIGFSGHSPLPRYGESWCMTEESAARYRAEIARLKEKYAELKEGYKKLWDLYEKYRNEVDNYDANILDYQQLNINLTKENEKLKAENKELKKYKCMKHDLLNMLGRVRGQVSKIENFVLDKLEDTEVIDLEEINTEIETL